MNEVENSKITFSKHLFWDIDPENLDYEKNAAFVIKNVLLYGLYSDWKTISGYYGLARIMDVALKMRNLDLKTASFLAIISGVPKEKFLCYSMKESDREHWHL